MQWDIYVHYIAVRIVVGQNEVANAKIHTFLIFLNLNIYDRVYF